MRPYLRVFQFQEPKSDRIHTNRMAWEAENGHILAESRMHEMRARWRYARSKHTGFQLQN